MDENIDRLVVVGGVEDKLFLQIEKSSLGCHFLSFFLLFISVGQVPSVHCTVLCSLLVGPTKSQQKTTSDWRRQDD